MDLLIPEWLLALTLTLFVLDVCLEVDYLSWGGVLSLAAYLTWRIGPSWKWSVLVFILALLVAALIYYGVFRLLIGRPIRGVMQHGSMGEVIERLPGARGAIHFVDGKPMFRWNGDELWPVATDTTTLNEDDRVVVVAIDEGRVRVKRI